MEKKKNLSTLAAGTLIMGAFAVSPNGANGNGLFEVKDLGSGAELRSDILSMNNSLTFTDNSNIELKCGEGTCGEGKKGEEKSSGEKAEKKSEKKAEKAEKAEKKSEKAESKSGEHKCGEGKCGEGKCGEGKCGH